MLSTKAKILIFTISSIIGTVALGAGVLAIRDAENRKVFDMDDFVENRKLDLSPYFSNSSYELTNYHSFSAKERYETEEKNVEIVFFTSDYSYEYDYAAVLIENDSGSTLTSFPLKTTTASIGNRIMYGLDSKKNVISFEKYFSGTCYFTPIAFYNSEREEGAFFKNVKTAKCYIKNYFALQNISVEKEEIELEQSSYQTVNVEIINAARKEITKIEIEKDGESIFFPVEEIKFEEKISYFSFFYEEENPGIHEIKLLSLTYKTETDEERNVPIVSEKVRYTADYSVYINSLYIQEAIFNRQTTFDISIFNKKTKNIIGIEFTLNNKTITQTLPASYKALDFCFYYKIPLLPSDFDLVHGSSYRIVITKVLLDSGWLQTFPVSANFVYQEFGIESSSIPSSTGGIATLKVELKNQLEGCRNFKTVVIFANRSIDVTFEMTDEKILEASFEIGYEHDYSISFNFLSFEFQGTRITFNFEEMIVFCY